MIQWLDQVFADRSFRGVRRGMTSQEVTAVLGEPARRQPEKKGRGGILAYAGVQVFTKGGVVDHLTIRLNELAEAVHRSDVSRAAKAHGMVLERSELMSDEHTEYLAYEGVHVVVHDGAVNFITICDPSMVV